MNTKLSTALAVTLLVGCQSGPDPKELDPRTAFAVVTFLFES